MAEKMRLSALFLSFFFFSPSFSFDFPHGADPWCKKTPYPETCQHFFKDYKNGLKLKSDFKKMAVQIALERALTADGHNKWLGGKCRNKKEKAAWADCMELYQSTIRHLNKTLDPTIKCTDFDSQTWLSSALTNLETCRTGFIELNVTDYVLPLMSNNVSKLISNALSIDGGNSSNQIPGRNELYKDGFPSWVSGGDRKLLQSSSAKANIVVAQDGSGNYRTVTEAVTAAGKRSGIGRFVIYVKKGLYEENIVIGTDLSNIMMIGDGMKFTIITGSKSVGGGSTTFKSATVGVTGDGFIARGITFRNTAGPAKHQAVALRSGSDLSVFYQCGFEGYQDTVYVLSQRQFYRECFIYGTVDFIFGNAAVVFQNCMIFPRRPMPGQQNTVTAQGRTDPNQNTGISIHNCRVSPASDLAPVQTTVKTYLGRPWKQYSRTVFMQTFLDRFINPAGWLAWSGNFALNTLYYGEYKNFGAGSTTNERVKWKGYRVITSAAEASQFTVQNFIAGSSWLPATKVPFTAGL